MKFAQAMILVLLFIHLLRMFYIDIKGQSATQPKGFPGLLTSLTAAGLAFLVYYFAGAFNQLF